jgi:hypothetical protein
VGDKAWWIYKSAAVNAVFVDEGQGRYVIVTHHLQMDTTVIPLTPTLYPPACLAVFYIVETLIGSNIPTNDLGWSP